MLLTFFSQKPRYSYIQEHLIPSTTICIFPCFFMNNLEKKKVPGLIPQPSYISSVGFSVVVELSGYHSMGLYNHFFEFIVRIVDKEQEIL